MVISAQRCGFSSTRTALAKKYLYSILALEKNNGLALSEEGLECVFEREV
jgi:hypothetical protein